LAVQLGSCSRLSNLLVKSQPREGAMRDTVTLSETAVAVLRFRVKGYRLLVRE
jgi:hypothetical protein